MVYQKSLVFLLVLLGFSNSFAQDKNYARSIVDTLASPSMYGRGYVNQGDSLAAAFIFSQFEYLGLKSLGEDYYQPFNINVNTFPGRVALKLNGKELNPGDEFAFRAASHSDKGEYRIRTFNRKILEKPKRLERLANRDNSQYYIFYDLDLRAIESTDTLIMIDSIMRNNVVGSRGYIVSRPAISWHVWSREMSADPFTFVDLRSDLISGRMKKLEIDVESQWIENYETRNVIGWIPGKTQPEKFLVVTAHYDHIGMMGSETLFPGANDNASGTAMLIDLARHYSLPENQPDYSMAFMAFGGEETGLLGSKFYTENPFFPLENILFLINLDMVGTGGDGLLVFNGTTDSLRFETMNSINESNQYLKELRMRGESRSSDHYYFHQNGVPAFFLLTFGSEHRHYHNIWDTRESLPLTKYDEVFRLITDFFDTF